MEYIYIILQTFVQDIPWKELGLFIGGGATGGGIAKLIERFLNHSRVSKERKIKVENALRDELRKEIDELRTRLQKTEDELITWRKKHFDFQEKYYELRRQNENLQEKVSALNDELKKYRNS